MIFTHRGGGLHSKILFLLMTLPPLDLPQQPENAPNITKAVILESLAFSERGREEKGEGSGVRPVASPVQQANTEGSGTLYDLVSARAWRNHAVWRAGASALEASALLPIILLFTSRSWRA